MTDTHLYTLPYMVCVCVCVDVVSVDVAVVDARLHHNAVVQLLQPRTSRLTPSCLFREPKMWGTAPV